MTLGNIGGGLAQRDGRLALVVGFESVCIKFTQVFLRLKEWCHAKNPAFLSCQQLMMKYRHG